jgi:hypothetical protein
MLDHKVPKPALAGSSHTSAVAPRVSLQARSRLQEDSGRGFIPPSLNPRPEFWARHPSKDAESVCVGNPYAEERGARWVGQTASFNILSRSGLDRGRS